MTVATYEDAVKAGAAAQVTVCWLPAPRPQTYIGSAPMHILRAGAVQNNQAFLKMAADVIGMTPGDTGCLCRADDIQSARRIAAAAKCPLLCRGGTGYRVAMADVERGVMRKAVFPAGGEPYGPGHGVLLMATCGGAEETSFFPWRRASRPGERAYIVDFLHKWDAHNGRPGPLALNDAARMRSYEAMGFLQMELERKEQLPFV